MQKRQDLNVARNDARHRYMLLINPSSFGATRILASQRENVVLIGEFCRLATIKRILKKIFGIPLSEIRKLENGEGTFYNLEISSTRIEAARALAN